MSEHVQARRIESSVDHWLAQIREAISDVIDADDDTAMMYLTAVVEIATNAFESHERADVDEPVIVVIYPEDSLVTVTDLGGGFDPEASTSLPAPDQVSGRGLYLARSFCPNLSWQRNSTGMHFTLPFP